jgi:hypothetical protein
MKKTLLLGALAALTNSADVLWGIADDMVMTTETARSILLFSLRNRLPLIGLSGAWVKAGALMALSVALDSLALRRRAAKRPRHALALALGPGISAEGLVLELP